MDTGWGPQDVSQPSKDPVVAATQTVLVAECRFLCGWVVVRCARPVSWGVIRMGKVARSLCEAEIVSIDEGCKFMEHHCHVLADMECPDVSPPCSMIMRGQLRGPDPAPTSGCGTSTSTRVLCRSDGKRV